MLEVGGHELQCVIGGGVELGTQRFFSFFFFHFDSRNKTSWQSFYCLPGALFDQIWQRWCLPPSVSPCHLGIACANFFLWKCLCKRVWLVILARDSPQYFQQEKKKKKGVGGGEILQKWTKKVLVLSMSLWPRLEKAPTGKCTRREIWRTGDALLP